MDQVLDDIFVDVIETPDGLTLDLLPQVEQKCGGEGGTPGPCPEGNKPEASPKPAGTTPDHHEAAKKWTQRAKELPKKIATAARNKIKDKYQKLESRYGRKFAIAIMGAGIAGLPLPVPGSSLITAAPVIAAAELFRAFHKAMKNDQGEGLTQEQIEELGRQWMAELLQEWAEEQGLQEQKATDDCVSEKIRILINEGKSPEQAAAIAYSMCGEK